MSMLTVSTFATLAGELYHLVIMRNFLSLAVRGRNSKAMKGDFSNQELDSLAVAKPPVNTEYSMSGLLYRLGAAQKRRL